MLHGTRFGSRWGTKSDKRKVTMGEPSTVERLGTMERRAQRKAWVRMKI